MPRDVGVVLVAAGSSTRLGGSTPKQFRAIAGVPMVLRALRPFASHPEAATQPIAHSFPRRYGVDPTLICLQHGSKPERVYLCIRR